MKVLVEFENGTVLSDWLSDRDDFNLWVENAISNFGGVTNIQILEVKKYFKD